MTNKTPQYPEQEETLNGKPMIRLPGAGVPLSEFAEQLGTMLRDKGIFRRNKLAFALDDENQKLEAADADWLRSWIEDHVVPYAEEGGGKGRRLIKVVKTISKDTANAVLKSPQFLSRLVSIERFNPCPMPVIRDDGELVLLPVGLDEISKTYTADPGFAVREIPLDEAKGVLLDLLGEFALPEDGGRSLAVHVSAMLCVFAIGLLPRGTICPVFVYLANSEGAGKTLLAELAGIPYVKVAAETAPKSEEEWQKKLLALVMSGRRVVLIDNVKGHLNSGSLEAYATSSTFGGRILGGNRYFEGDADATVLITGNGLTISGDLRRRSLLIEMFMSEMRAEDRSFKRILDAETVRQLRPRVLSALWSLVKAWDAAGRPEASRINSSFPRWSKVIGGIVEHAGFACPLERAQIEGMGDTDAADLEELVAGVAPNERHSFDDLVAFADERGLFERFLCNRDHEGKLKAAAKSSLGKFLTRFDRRRVLPDRIFAVEGKGKSRKYVVLGIGGTGGTGVSASKENDLFRNGPKYHADLSHHAHLDPEAEDGDLHYRQRETDQCDPEDADAPF